MSILDPGPSSTPTPAKNSVAKKTQSSILDSVATPQPTSAPRPVASAMPVAAPKESLAVPLPAGEHYSEADVRKRANAGAASAGNALSYVSNRLPSAQLMEAGGALTQDMIAPGEDFPNLKKFVQTMTPHNENLKQYYSNPRFEQVNEQNYPLGPGFNKSFADSTDPTYHKVGHFLQTHPTSTALMSLGLGLVSPNVEGALLSTAGKLGGLGAKAVSPVVRGLEQADAKAGKAINAKYPQVESAHNALVKRHNQFSDLMDRTSPIQRATVGANPRVSRAREKAEAQGLGASVHHAQAVGIGKGKKIARQTFSGAPANHLSEVITGSHLPKPEERQMAVDEYQSSRFAEEFQNRPSEERDPAIHLVTEWDKQKQALDHAQNMNTLYPGEHKTPENLGVHWAPDAWLEKELNKVAPNANPKERVQIINAARELELSRYAPNVQSLAPERQAIVHRMADNLGHVYETQHGIDNQLDQYGLLPQRRTAYFPARGLAERDATQEAHEFRGNGDSKKIDHAITRPWTKHAEYATIGESKNAGNTDAWSRMDPLTALELDLGEKHTAIAKNAAVQNVYSLRKVGGGRVRGVQRYEDENGNRLTLEQAQKLAREKTKSEGNASYAENQQVAIDPKTGRPANLARKIPNTDRLEARSQEAERSAKKMQSILTSQERLAARSEDQAAKARSAQETAVDDMSQKASEKEHSFLDSHAAMGQDIQNRLAKSHESRDDASGKLDDRLAQNIANERTSVESGREQVGKAHESAQNRLYLADQRSGQTLNPNHISRVKAVNKASNAGQKALNSVDSTVDRSEKMLQKAIARQQKKIDQINSGEAKYVGKKVDAQGKALQKGHEDAELKRLAHAYLIDKISSKFKDQLSRNGKQLNNIIANAGVHMLDNVQTLKVRAIVSKLDRATYNKYKDYMKAFESDHYGKNFAELRKNSADMIPAANLVAKGLNYHGLKEGYTIQRDVADFLEREGIPKPQATGFGVVFNSASNIARQLFVSNPLIHGFVNMGTAYVARTGDTLGFARAWAPGGEMLPGKSFGRWEHSTDTQDALKRLAKYHGYAEHEFFDVGSLRERPEAIRNQQGQIIDYAGRERGKEYKSSTLKAHSNPEGYGGMARVDHIAQRLQDFNTSLVFERMEKWYAVKTFQHAVKNGASDAEASRIVRATFGQDLVSGFEEHPTFRALTWFPNWKRTIVPLMASMAIKDPRWWSAPTQAAQSERNNTGFGYMKSAPLALTYRDENGDAVMYSFPNPIDYLNKLAAVFVGNQDPRQGEMGSHFKGISDTALGTLNPIASNALHGAEETSGYDLPPYAQQYNKNDSIPQALGDYALHAVQNEVYPLEQAQGLSDTVRGRGADEAIQSVGAGIVGGRISHRMQGDTGYGYKYEVNGSRFSRYSAAKHAIQRQLDDFGPAGKYATNPNAPQILKRAQASLDALNKHFGVQP